MRVVLTRDSVCMGDDVDAPHEGVWEVDENVTMQDLLEQSAGYLLRMQNACWVAYLGYGRADGEPVALFTPEWSRPRIAPGLDITGQLGTHPGKLEIFWAYRSQADAVSLWRQMGGGQAQPLIL
ncbi:hypothetical protein [Kitasatospora sp. NPDC097691]|uniref:hypothetical protein n=1 Tax=Kitasatospora sp. NPDC097691 TaxID=3157231 RepID=UPI0033281176